MSPWEDHQITFIKHQAQHRSQQWVRKRAAEATTMPTVVPEGEIAGLMGAAEAFDAVEATFAAMAKRSAYNFPVIREATRFQPPIPNSNRVSRVEEPFGAGRIHHTCDFIPVMKTSPRTCAWHARSTVLSLHDFDLRAQKVTRSQ